MSAYISEVSLCHFKPVTRGGHNDFMDEQYFYCSHCGDEAKETLVVPEWYLDQSIEVAIRRFKDNDLKFNDVGIAILKEFNGYKRDMIKQIADKLDDGKPDAWELKPGMSEWTPNQ